MNRKARSTLHVFVVSRSRLRLGHRCLAFCSHSSNNLPSRSAVAASRTTSNSRAAYTHESVKQSYRSHGTNGANCFSLNGLGGIRRAELEPETTCRNQPIRGQIRVNFRGLPDKKRGLEEAGL